MTADNLDSSLMENLADIDKMIHEPARLQIVALLYVVEEADFLFIMNQSRLTRGNLSSHISKLESAGYVAVAKGFVNKTPRTTLSLTDAGRKAFDDYRSRMQLMLAGLPELRS